MTPEIIAAIISAAVALLVAMIMNYQSRTQMFSSVVSRERMVWVKDIREKAAELFAICEQYESFSSLPPEKYAEYLKAKNALILRLSPRGRYQVDDEILDLLLDRSYDEVRADVPAIREKLVLIGKTEWDKVKIEAGNNRLKVKRVKAIQKKLGYAKDGEEQGKNAEN